jgi:hypothetical protein
MTIGNTSISLYSKLKNIKNLNIFYFKDYDFNKSLKNQTELDKAKQEIQRYISNEKKLTARILQLELENKTISKILKNNDKSD